MQTAPPKRSAFDADDWWDPDGFLYGLNTLFEPLRGPYMISTLRDRGVIQGSRVLDVGSGGGFLAATLSEAGYEVIGVDPEITAVRDAAEHVAASFVLAVGENLPFADDSFEAAMCSEVLEHVKDPGAVVAEISRVLRPGGTFVFSVPNRTRLSRLVLINAAQRNKITRVLPQDVHDWNRFIGSRDLRALAGRHHLMVRQIHGISIRLRDVPAAVRALVDLRRNRISYGDAGSRVRLSLSRLRAVAYVGYASKAKHRPDTRTHATAMNRHQPNSPTNGE
jgi:2-polyprenyl-6-hydroxyphenyl methylase/3-demethylubiquinone-9 3-methyltransferase